jgi:hypothetical protein
VQAISDQVVSDLSDASLPPLTDGQILIGREHVFEASAPPRIVFVPVYIDRLPKSVTSSRSPSTRTESRTEWLQRGLGTKEFRFEVHVWGQAVTPDPVDDFDATILLGELVERTAHLLFPGCVSAKGGPWADQTANASQLNKAGHELVFELRILKPLDDVFADGSAKLEYVPIGTVANPTILLDLGDGSSPEGP